MTPAYDSPQRSRYAATKTDYFADSAVRRIEAVLLAFASLAVAAGILLVYLAKSSTLPEIGQKLASGEMIDLSGPVDTVKLKALLNDIPAGPERSLTADWIVSESRKQSFRSVANGLANLRISRDRITRSAMPRLADRAANSQRQTVALLSDLEVRNLKPFFAVRTPEEFRNRVVWCSLTFFLVFWSLHFMWRYFSFAGDQIVFPAILLLSGIGLTMMISLKDPVRDNLLFIEFTQGILLGAVAMAYLSTVDYERLVRRYTFIFIPIILILGGALASPLGKGPAGSDAKVNLFFFQPVEIMRLLIVLFLGGYLGRNWDMLRDLKARVFGTRLALPRPGYIVPPALGVLMAVGLFFLVKDNGPALVIGVSFLVLYAIARNRGVAAVLGLAVIVAVFYFGHEHRVPLRVAQRTDMWLSPWRNTVPGGDQVAQAMWSLSAGSLTGTGLGLGSPATIPAGETDLILSSVGEELGFAGLLAVFSLYSLLIWRGVRTAIASPNGYTFFLSLGLTVIVGLQLILIAAGEFGLIPLSGVVSPFLSFGRTSMVANFIAFAIVISISGDSRPGRLSLQFGKPVRWLGAVFAFCMLAILAKAASIQLLHADEILVQDVEVRQADRSLGLAYNPRIREAMRLIPKGDIVDRNGLPIATGNYEKVLRRKADYEKLGIELDSVVKRSEPRHYPLGPEFFYLVGDTRSNLRVGASNAAFQERNSRTRLQGFDDLRRPVTLKDGDDEYHVNEYSYTELIPLVRHRHDLDDPDVRALLDQNRNVRMSIDAGFQLKASAILRGHLAGAGLNGSIVVLDPASGDLLAAVSYPWPEPYQFDAFRAHPDRLMELIFQDRARFGLYPPGSSFKIVTAVAALRQSPVADGDIMECIDLGGKRVGNYVGNSTRPVRDDEQDTHPHGKIAMAQAIVVSCNAYFAQLGYKVGAQAVFDTAQAFGIHVALPNTAARLRVSLPQASYGQGEVVASPFQMARVAATIANHGRIPQGRWIIDETNTRTLPPTAVVPPESAAKIAAAMRQVVADPAGTGRKLRNSPVTIAGKTGTAEVGGRHRRSHAWFIGFAPAELSEPRHVAFAVIVEHGGYGGDLAATIAGEIVQAAKEVGLI